jgi:hypothetical protein
MNSLGLEFHHFGLAVPQPEAAFKLLTRMGYLPRCGWAGQMLKRYLTTARGLSVDEYRSRWSLPPDYPMVAKNYAAWRSELAKSIRLGRRGQK